MRNQINAGRASCSDRREGYELHQAIDQTPPMSTWQFVEDFQQMMGMDAEPDSLFFVESWSLGKPEALVNLKQRRMVQADCEHKNHVFGDSSNFGRSIFAIGERFPVVQTSPKCSPADNDICDAVTMREASTDPAMYTQRHAKDESDAFNGGWHGSQDSSHPMTHELASQLLCVTETSTLAEIKAAYRKKVAQWHPDRLERYPAETRQLATQKMAAINRAYRLLHNGRR